MPGITDTAAAQATEEPGRLATVEALRVLEDPTDVKLKTLTQLARVAFGGSSLSGASPRQLLEGVPDGSRWVPSASRCLLTG